MGVAFRFVHTADLHLDSPFAGIGQVAPHLQAQLQEATFAAFHQIVDLCLREQVDFLTISGDIFDHAHISLRAQVRFREELKRLSDAGISSFVLFGNHDHGAGERAELKWPERVHIFPAGKVEAVPVYKEGREIARVYGISYPRAEVKENLAKRFRREEGVPYAIALLHANVGSDSEHANYAPCTLGDLQASGFDFWGLGHIHKRALLQTEHPVILYPGNPQGRHINESGERGCYLVEVDEHGETECRFHAVDSVRWTAEEVTIEGLTQEEELYQRMLAQLEAAGQKHRGRTVMVRLILTGRGALHEKLCVPGALDEWLQMVREHDLAVGEHPVYCETIQRKTRPLLQREEKLNDPGLLGDVVALVDACRSGKEGLDFLREALQPLFASPYVRQVLPEPDEQQLLDWLAEAEDLLIEWLGKDGS